jgi:hypothetical protein
MARSLSDWLALREPADVAARSAALAHAVLGALGPHQPLRILDLATGTGSNVRYLIDRLPSSQSWLLVDRDPDLLAEVPARMASWAGSLGYDFRDVDGGHLLRSDRTECRIETRCLDLGSLDHPDIFAGRHLVTASALLDLVSERWLRQLAELCGRSGAAVLFALTYTGASHCAPLEPEDDMIRELMNRHQRNDKGFAPAAGPEATECAARCFEQAGYRVQRRGSDWVLTPDARGLQTELMEGWAQAATEIAPQQSTWIQDWLTRRLIHIARGRSHVTVGHEDLVAWPHS